MKRGQQGFAHPFIILIFIFVLGAVGFTGWKVYKNNQSTSSVNNKSVGNEMNRGCKGTGAATITASPIALSDLLYIQPIGLEIGGHVTPIDHGYFYIKGALANPTTQAAVYAPFDGIVTNVSLSVRNSGSGSTHPETYNDYAVSVDATCNFRVRFSNMVRFAGGLADKVGQLQNNQIKTPAYAVKSGELIGYTGLPTAYGIDVWVEDDNSTLTGFVNPAQYTAAEAWKTHAVDLFDHTKEPLKSQLLALDLRDASPRWGKIDYDIDGKLIGSWFKKGTGGYGGGMQGGEGYWAGHLSVVPDGNDPTWTDISFGDYQGQPQQFAVIGNTPDPAKVDSATGLVKFQLGQIEHYSATTGEIWGGQAYVPHIRTRANNNVKGTVLMQMTDKRTLKMEIFPGKTAAQVSGFDSSALIYTR
ncbi:hypothetical protein KW801_01650 [Candidatus Saccharibacteria bacterium]|nr:hypothetical protein [Candidatus Saccharibacteria bacterium]